MEWIYQSPTKKSTGYEDLYEKLSSYKSEDYKKASQEEKDRILDEVADIYQERGIFPIYYFNEEGIREEIQRAIDFEALIKDDVVNTGAGVCTHLCNFFMPNLYEAYNKYSKASHGANPENESGEFKFTNREFLRKCIRFAISCDNSALPESVMAGIRQVGSLPSNFRPMNAQAIYEAYCPEGGVIYDYSCGFGGRLTGALTSKKNFTYIGTEPNSKTFENLHRLGHAIESVTGRTNSFKIVKLGSEKFKTNPEIFDFAFSSPPYFDLECYCDEPTQCYNAYPNIYDWFDKYVNATIRNIYNGLKHDRYYAVNIADFNYKGKVMNYVDVWKAYSEKAGFEYIKDLRLKLSVHAGSSDTKFKRGKSERIMVFYKP